MGNPPGWTSIWADGCPPARAVYPEMMGSRAAPAQKELLSCLTLHRMGVAWPGTLLPPPVVSYTTLSPLLTQR
ncbi:protein of unknown function [Brevefilum fermentans]|uniref:Uncharacterized protein n=1 Tax=Candidatus Brevifilum fermentans TaxID=1986204 RepID=A0A1Y6K582_9CHLR|nr:protein of unknown function [Brevefilum fermentans]